MSCLSRISERRRPPPPPPACPPPPRATWPPPRRPEPPPGWTCAVRVRVPDDLLPVPEPELLLWPPLVLVPELLVLLALGLCVVLPPVLDTFVLHVFGVLTGVKVR